MKKSVIVIIGATTAAIAAFVLFGGVVLARGDFPGSRSEIRRYIRDEVLPVILEERKKLSLDAEEERVLQDIRGALKALREDRRRAVKVRRGDVESDETTDVERREAMWEHKKLMNRVTGITLAHEEEVFRLLDNVRAHEARWRRDIQDIVEQYRADRAPDGAGPDANRARGPHRWMDGPYPVPGGSPGAGGMHMIRRFGAPEFFVLLDPNGEDLPGMLDISSKSRLYPNPAESTVVVDLDVAGAGDAVITMYDRGGEVVKRVEAVLPAHGERPVAIDIGDLAPGLYIYEVVVDRQIIDTDRIVVQ